MLKICEKLFGKKEILTVLGPEIEKVKCEFCEHIGTYGAKIFKKTDTEKGIKKEPQQTAKPKKIKWEMRGSGPALPDVIGSVGDFLKIRIKNQSGQWWLHSLFPIGLIKPGYYRSIEAAQEDAEKQLSEFWNQITTKYGE